MRLTPPGADAVQTFEAKASALFAQAQAHRELSTALAHENNGSAFKLRLGPVTSPIRRRGRFMGDVSAFCP